MNPTTPADTPPDITLGTLLIHALSAEQARENNRRAVERAAARSSIEAAMLSAQIAALNAGDPYSNFPAALRLRAYANNEFGQDFTPEAVRKIRGRVCEVLDIDTAAADALPLARVVEALQAPRAAEADDLSREFRWLRVRQIARLFDFNAGTVAKMADAGTFVTNGQSGYDRRIDVLSVVRRQLAQLERPEDTEADG